jgi:transcriptional regulator with XRE-family HTH domain
MALSRRSRSQRTQPVPHEDETAGLTQEICDEITWYMREQKMSRADLAGAMGVSAGRVSQILSGDENLTLRTLSSVIAALGARFEFTLTPHDDVPVGAN